MNAFYQTLLPAYTPEIDNNAIEFVVEQPFKILISEKEYSELKCEIGYWQAMHKTASGNGLPLGAESKGNPVPVIRSAALLLAKDREKTGRD